MKRGAAPCVAPRPSAGWLVFAVFVVMASRGVALAAGARIEFATAEAVGRGIHPVRLFVDATGPRRETPLALDAPPGTRFMRPPPASVPEGASAPEVLIFHLLVPAGAAAGVLDLHGSLGGTPLRAMLPVRGLPDFQVLGAPRERLIGFGGGGIPVTLVVRNRGNTALSFRAFSQTGDNGPRVAIESDSFTLDAGGERKVSLAVLPPEQARAATEGTAAVLFEGRAEGFERTDPVVLNTLFVPENPRPGHLHATLSGFVETGLLAGDGRAKSATQVRLSGEVGPGVRLEAHALDGETSVLGSQLGLSGRDAWHVGLAAAGWSATVGETRAPSLGFVAPGAFGRGFTGGLRRDSWSADGFALRDSLGGSVRETAGFRVAGPGASWEAGAMLQRNREFSFVREERAGAFAGLHWAWSGIKGHTQLAVAGSGGSGVNPGFAQTVDYQGERARINAQFERAERGFFLQDQKSERRSLHGEWSAGGGWVLLSEFDRSEQAGRLRTLLRERDSLGQSDDPVEVIELINEVATRQESLAAGFRRDFTPGSFKAVFRRQERVGELVAARTFVEDAIDAEWTRRASDPWWRLGATLGREKGGGESARFAEIRGSAQWSPTRWSHLDGSVRWTSALSGDPRGFRRAGIHGQINATASLARGWNAGLRVEGYDFDGFESRTRLGAVLRFPLGRQGWSGAVEWGRDTRTGDETAWLVLRAPLSIGMPWRPVRGTVGGRVVDAATGAGLPHVLVRSGAQVAVSDETGRYQLPAMEPGMNPITVQAPSGWTEPASSSRAVTVVAGRRDSLDIALVELGTLRGEIRILDASGSATAVPAGVVVAEGDSGSVHETLAYRGLFTMRLPPGTYRLKFVSGLPDSVGRQLDTGATVGGADPVTVRMEARTEARRIRRTLTSEKRDSTDPGRG